MEQPHGSAVPSARPARGALARRLYLEGASMAEIRRQTGLSSATVYYWIDRERGPDGTTLFNPVPRRTAPPVGGQPAKARSSDKLPPAASGKPDRRGLLKRLWRAAERQIDEIEGRLARAAEPGDQAPRPEPEKDARALAVMARTLRELTALEAEAKKRRKAKDQDGTVRDLDTFRRELARRLDRLREGGDGAGAS